MSTPTDEDVLRRRYKEFLDLLPLTLAIAGLPESQGSMNFTPEQMEARAITLLHAFKRARHLAREAIAS